MWKYVSKSVWWGPAQINENHMGAKSTNLLRNTGLWESKSTSLEQSSHNFVARGSEVT